MLWRRGYLTTLLAEFYQRGLHLVIKLGGRMTNRLMPLSDKLNLGKGRLIESVNAWLASVFEVEHTRHRSALNGQINVLAGLMAYCFHDHKPGIGIPVQKRIYP